MLINKVCKKCRLTKKAIEYYAEQSLVHPETLENGYRNFSAADIERLKKIAILRRLGLSVQSHDFIAHAFCACLAEMER